MSAEAGWTLINGSTIWVVLVVLVSAVSLLSGFLASAGLSGRRRVILFFIRLASLLFLAIAILRPARLEDITRLRKPPLQVMLDRSQSMVHGGLTAGNDFAAWFSENQDRLEELAKYYRLDYVGLGAPPERMVPSSLEPAETYTEPESPIRLSLEHQARTGGNVAGLILFSDGQDTLSPDDPPLGLPFPVYSVIGEDSGLKDLRVEAVNTPPVAFVRTPLTIRVRLGASGYTAREAMINLLEEGRLIASESVRVDQNGAEALLSFTPRRTGRWAYSLEVQPWEGERVHENNRARFSLRVIRDKTRVLLVAGTPSWDVKFLRRRLKQDPGIDLITFLILRTPQDLNLVPQNEMSLIPFPTRELFSEELPSFDAVIFANFNYGPYVPVQYLENLAKFVREDGGGFVMIGGERSFALGGYIGTPLEQILPVEITGARPGFEYTPRQYRPRLTQAGESHPIMQWKTNPRENLAYWDGLPQIRGLNWFLRPRPGGLVLVENPEQRNEYGPLPVILTGEFGSGRTLVIGSDHLWRWALPNAGAGGSPAAYRDFWTRALKWIVHDPDMELVRLAIPPPPVRAGQAVVFQARVLDRYYAPATGAVMDGFVGPGPAQKSISLQWKETAPGEYRSDPVRLPRSGSWRVEVSARLGQTFLGKDGLGFSVEPESSELLNTGINHPYLEKVSQTSGGESVPLNGLNALLERLAERGRRDLEIVGRNLDEVWPVWPLLVLGLIGLGTDWGLRRFWN